MGARWIWVMAVLVLVPSLAAAQEPAPSPSPAASPAAQQPSPAPPAAEKPAAAPAEKAKAPGEGGEGEVRIRADTFGGEKGLFHYRGFVDLKTGEIRIQADTLDYKQTTLPDGKTQQTIVAEGNVVFMRGDERVAGRRLEMDIDKGSGVFEDARGYVSPGVFVEATKIERVDSDTYRIEGGKFTSCAQPTPRWSFSASSARLEVEDKIVAHNVLFKVKQVPA